MALSLATTTVDTGTVLLLITLVTAPIAAIAFAGSGRVWREIGKGRFAIEQDHPPKGTPEPDPATDKAEQAAEARQMLEAKSYRRRQRGEAPLNVESELKRLLGETSSTHPTPDAELRSEVRRLVITRNERRLRQGKAPLDVEAETERQLADSIGSG
ncbi:MAG: hypothetical protein WBM00_01865 [Solirubrobacterales bacterium]